MDRSIRDRLRDEYFSLRAEAQRAVDVLEARVRHALIPLSAKLSKYEGLAFESRVKDCESAIGKLSRQQEGRVFDPDRPNQYSIKSLRDLAAVRVMAFPFDRWRDANEILTNSFPDWESKHIHLDGEPGELLAYKYSGMLQECPNVVAELQIAPMLIALFWKVEHSAIY